MTGLRPLLGRVMGRTGVALVMAAAVVALAPMAPPASATPEGDADAAVTQAWETGGGPTGPLGPKDGGVYPVGAGFGQNFAGGRIFFTPDTGAHVMTGAILDKYLALGGPGDGDLGFPNIDEGAGRAPGSRNTTFSAADRPVIFWTPDTGARVVRGAINAAWDKLGGSAATLGVPTEDEVYSGDEVSQTFTGGELSWNRETKAFTSTPPELSTQLAGLDIPGDATTEIDAARRAAGGRLGPLGAAQGSPASVGSDGLEQTYAGGKIFYTPATGASVLTTQVLAKYESVGGPTGDLGFPTTSETDGGLTPASRIASFAADDEPVIFWTPDFGATIVRGAMNAAWKKLGGAEGTLGAPTADQTEADDVVTQKFANGAISWNRATGQFTTEPANLASQLSGVAVPGRSGPQASAAAGPDAAGGQAWYRQWWWALAIVPVALLVAAVVAAVVFNRRRRDDRPPLDRFDEVDGFDDHSDEYFDDYSDDDYSGDYSDDDSARDERRGRWDDPDSDEYADDLEPGSGPLPVADASAVAQPPLVPLSVWATPADADRPPAPAASSGAGLSEAEHGGLDDDLDDDLDDAATTPTRVVSADDLPHDDAASQSVETSAGPPSGRHAAIQLGDAEPAQTSLRLAFDDPFNPPAGYSIKADTKTGLYWLPGSGSYDRIRAEIWFASEEFALTNGFVRG